MGFTGRTDIDEDLSTEGLLRGAPAAAESARLRRLAGHSRIVPTRAIDPGKRAMARLLRQERRRLDPRNLKHSPATLAGNLVVQKHHIARGFGKLRAIALVGIPGERRDFLTHEPPQLVRVGRPAKRAVQSGWLRHLRFPVKGSFVQIVIRCCSLYRLANLKLATATSSLGGI